MGKVINKAKICCVFNHAPHYRNIIFSMLDEEFNCSFYIGDRVISDVKQMNYRELKGFKKVFKNKWILGTSFMWNQGVGQLIFKTFDSYLIIGEPSILSNWVFLIFGRILNKKVYTWGHGIKDLKKRKLYWFERLFYKLAYKNFVYGNHARSNMIRLGYKEERIITIYNSLDHEKQLQIRKKTKKTTIFSDYFKNNHPVIIYVGRILHSKKIDLLIEALNNTQKSEKKFNLVIVGPEVDDKSIPQLVKDLGLTRYVWFYGPCYQEDKLAELFFNSDVCVTPGNIGLTAIHSLTYGCPVISHDNIYEHGPEYEVIVEGKTGSFFKEDNVMELTEKIEFWIGKENIEKREFQKQGFRLIDELWNPFNQINIFKKHLAIDN